MAQTKIKAAQFSGVIGNGTNGYVLQSSGNGDMEWVSLIVNPTVLSVTYPGDDTAADPTGGQTVTITGTGFKTGANVTIGGTAATSVSFVSATTLTITTPAKAAGDYDIVVTNTDTGTGTKINAISYNGVPAWTTAAGSLGTFASGETISTITLQASEPDAGTITFDIISGTLPTGLSLTGANINGTTSLETADTLYNFTIEAIDDENQATPRAFSITVTKQFLSTENFTINTYTGNGSTQSIEGKIGTAASFNGSSSVVSGVLPGLTGNPIFSISFWVNPNAPNGSPIVFGNAVNGQAFVTFINASNKLNFGRWGDGLGDTTASISNNAWTHVAISNNAGSVQVYVNGNADLSFTTTYNIGSNNFYIGSAVTSQYLNGKMDQVRIFNKAISSSEVTTLYNEPSNPSTASTTDIFNDGSGIALYEFEKGGKDTGGVSGYIGNGGVFNGSSSAITLPAIGNSYPFSYSCWIYPNETDNNVIINDTVSGARLVVTIGDFFSQTNNLMVAFGGANHLTTATNTITVGSWQHIAVIVNSQNNADVYINGSSVTVTNQGGVAGGSASYHIGSTSGTSEFFDGKIDQFRIFDKALSSSEVTTLYGETSASATKSTTDIFDDGSGISLYELEGNANDSGRFGRGAIDSGQSAVFNGSSSKIVTSPQINQQAFSFSLWFKYTSTDIYEVVWEYHDGGSDISGTPNALFMNTQPSGGVSVALGYNGSYKFNFTHSTTGLNDGNWHHAVFSWDGTTSTNAVKFYVDNVVTSSTSSLAASNMATYNGLGIGSRYISTLGIWSGSIDQIRIYSSALSASDVEALVSETNVPTANLVAHYKLDGNANDETGTYNGTATSITYSAPAEFPTYDGTATNVSYAYDGTPTNVNFVGTSFEPNLVWIKKRSGAQVHNLYDSVRGVSKVIYSDLTNAEATVSSISSFDTNGITLGNGGGDTNASNETYVSWMWKAGGSVTPNNNTEGSITSTVSANPAAGFSIVKYTGNNTSSTVGHGLSSAPELIICKNLDATGVNWVSYDAINGKDGFLSLNQTSSFASYSNYWGTSNPTNSVFSVYSGYTGNNTNNENYIAYCFHSVDGYQKVGSYTGGTSGVQVTTGFKPRWVMLKNTTTSGDGWCIFDTIRSGETIQNDILFPNLSDAESVNNSNVYINVNSTGFTVANTFSISNGSGNTYIYLAIA